MTFFIKFDRIADMNVPEKLQVLQDISGKTQTQLASELVVSFAAFNNWWTGKAVPRRDAETRINKLLSSYGVRTEDQNSIFEVKKNLISDLSKKNKNILQKILSRKDLIDELSLQITYNSNAIEGSTLSIADTASVIFDKKTLGNKTLNEQLEAKNHDRAFRYLLEALSKKQPVKELLAKELHTILMAGIRDDAGRYRTHPVRITGSFVPTANYLKVPILMKELFAQKKSNDYLKDSAHFHADFEKIHPFSDGNGRVGRLLLIGMLLAKNTPPAIIKRKKRPEYYKALQQAQLKEQYEAIELFICNAVLDGYKIIAD